MTDYPTDDDPSIVERIWSVLDAYGMGVMRKDDLDALNARIRELEAAIRQHCEERDYEQDQAGAADIKLWSVLPGDASPPSVE